MIEEDDAARETWFRVSGGDKQMWWDDHRESNSPMRVTEFIRMRVLLSEEMELRSFPYDAQSLHLHISSTWDCNNVLLSFSKEKPCAMNPDALHSQEFSIQQLRLIAFDTDWKEGDLPLLSDASQSATGARYSRAYLALMVTRRPGYYLWNVFFMVFVLGSLSFTAYAVPAGEVADRLSVLLTLVLSVVAFKYVLAQALPAISYLTMLDKYNIAAVATMFIIAISVSVIPNLGLEDDDLLRVDRAAAIVCGVLWLFANLWFLATAWRQQRVRAKLVADLGHRWDEYKREFAARTQG